MPCSKHPSQYLQTFFTSCIIACRFEEQQQDSIVSNGLLSAAYCPWLGHFVDPVRHSALL